MKLDYIIGDEKISRDDVSQLLDQYEPIFKKHQQVLIHTADPLIQNVSVRLCECLGNTLFLCPSYFTKAQVDHVISEYPVGLKLYGGQTEGVHYREFQRPRDLRQDPAIYVFTTGTTGTPKLIKHTWDTISASSFSVGDHLQGQTWLMSYAISGYAGLQVFFSADKNSGTIVYVPQGGFLNYCKSMSQHHVAIVSGTPTFWRLLINAWPDGLPKPHLLQATLGGEIVTQDVLNLVDHFFKPERLTHIYASTEAGTAIVVSDKKAGFPADALDSGKKVKLKIKDNVLEIFSPQSMKARIGADQPAPDDGWISSGDRVVLKDGRYYFCGRQDGMINIGGSKVLPEEVEMNISGLQGVEDCIVYEKKNPIIGALLAADILLKNGSSVSVPQIKKELGAALPAYKVPQYIRFVKEIAVSENGKKIRK